MILSLAQKLATDFLEEPSFKGLFERLEVAGSVRRKKPDCKDIELVAIVKPENKPFLAEKLLPCGYEGIKPGVSHNEKWPLKPDGKYWRLLRGGVRYDLFFARPENWGLIFAIRTGPAEFSASLLARWKKMSGGGYSKDGMLHLPDAGESKATVDTPDEETVFFLCGISYITPENRK